MAQQLTNDLTGAIGYIQQDFRTGSKSRFTAFETQHRYWRNREYSIFFQDTWKIRQNLTLNLGLRYELFSVPFERFGVFAQPVGGIDGMFGLVAQAGLPDNFSRINPQFQNARIVGNNSISNWNGLKLEVTRQFSQDLYFQANYTFNKGLTDYVGGQSQADDYRDNRNRRLDKTFSNFHATHVINANNVYELPIGRNKRWLANTNGFANNLVGNWQVNTIFGYATGWPLTVTSGYNNLTVGDTSTAIYAGTGYNILSKIIRGDQITTITPEQRALFSNPPAGSAGGVPQRAFRGTPYWTADISLFKEVYFTESKKLQLRFEFFNAFNHTNFDNRYVNTNINSASFGNVTAALSPRIIQFAGKIVF